MEVINDGYYILTEEEIEKLREKAKGRSLAEKNPELAEQWHPTLNGDLDPTMVMANSHKKVWWICPYDDPKTGKHFDFEWDAVVRDRVKSSGCPFLTGHRVFKGFNDLETLRPDIAADWHPTLNNGVLPSDVSLYSNLKVWWLTRHFNVRANEWIDLQWDATVESRTLGNEGCPYLSNFNSKVLEGFNDLETLRPDIASKWHPTKNGTLQPSNFLVNSNKIVWWYVELIDKQTKTVEAYEWPAMIAEMSRGKDCPYLQYSKGEKTIAKLLSKHSITFVSQEKIKTPLFKKYLRFDFFLLDFEIAIEYDGIQHFRDDKQFKDEKIAAIKKRDNAKTKYCLDNKISLLRIPYVYDPIKDKDKIEQLILDFIQTKRVPQEIIDFYSQFDFSDYGKILQKQSP